MKNADTCGNLNRKKKKIQRNKPLFFQKKLKKTIIYGCNLYGIVL